MMTSDDIIVPSVRLRRLRQHPRLRDLVRETTLSVNDFVLPLFIKAGEGVKRPIASMPGHYQWSLDRLDEILNAVVSSRIPAVILFGLPQVKDDRGSNAWQDHGVVQQAIQVIKSQNPQLLVIADLCFCEYTSHGHCGVLYKTSAGHYDVDNDATLALLVQQAISLVKAGADVIAPSGMMDGMVAAIRSGLDAAGYRDIAILSYSVKYASSFYGPFRDAAEGAPQFGDRTSYQMDPANGSRALREAQLDVDEGADMLMVKPAGPYLDVVYRVKQAHPGVPLGAYQVSGEFAMIKAAAEKGWVDEEEMMLESLLAIKRAGADFIITYYALEAAACLS
jgi:porphobilinogen synthase